MRLKIFNKQNIINFILYFVLLAIFFEIPYLLDNYPKFNTIYNVLQLGAVFVAVIMILFKQKFSKIIKYIFLYLAVLILASIIHPKSLSSAFFFSIKTMGLALLFDYGIVNDKYTFIRALRYFLGMLVLVNLATIIIYPKGLYITNIIYSHNWILGFKNKHIVYIFPYLLSCIIESYLYPDKNKLRLYIPYIICFISTLMVNNSTAIIGLLLMLIPIIIPNLIKNSKVFNIKNYYIIYIIMFISIVLLRVQNIFKWLIVDTLGKDLTFTGRIYVWDSVLSIIKNNLLFGMGYVQFQYDKFIYATHNMILDVLYKGGIALLIAYFIMYIVLIKKMMKYKENKLVQIISVSIFAFLIMGLTETYNLYLYVYLLIIGYNVDSLVGE